MTFIKGFVGESILPHTQGGERIQPVKLTTYIYIL